MDQTVENFCPLFPGVAKFRKTLHFFVDWLHEENGNCVVVASLKDGHLTLGCVRYGEVWGASGPRRGSGEPGSGGRQPRSALPVVH